MNPRHLHATIAAAAALNLTMLAQGQPCEPLWNTDIGNPALTQGYAQPMFPFDDGGGPRLYVGGSFTSVAGVGGTALIARWDPAAGAWSSVGGGLNRGSTNGFVADMVAFDPGTGTELIAGGFFLQAFGVDGTKSLARWDGQRWASLGAGFVPNSASAVWALAAWDAVGGERLYVGGSFPDAGGALANGIAAWDGESWHSLGSGITGPFAPNVFDLIVFDDGSGEALYASGRFATMGGISAALIARWDGEEWSRVGSGLNPSNSLGSVEIMTIFDDGDGPALYVGGSNFAPPVQPSASVAKWDGQTWTTIGQNVGGRVTSLAAFDDGNGEALYLAGTATPGINYFARLEGNQWVAAEGGVGGAAVPPSNFPSVFGLRVWGDSLYVAGNFTQVGEGDPTNGLAALEACGGFTIGDVNCDGAIDAFDIEPFILALLDPNGYMFAFPDCDIDTADINGDGVVDAFDIEAFIALLVGP